MQPDVKRSKRAIVLGGTGYVGSALLRELARRDVPTAFTFRQSEDKARVLATELGHTAHRVELSDPAALRAWLDGQDTPDVLIHCAVATGDDLRHTMAVNVEAAHVACQWLAARGAPADIVLVGGLDRTQSLPLPPVFAATQGALSALAMALGHELGPKGIRINLLALGVLAGGISTTLAARRRKDYETFSALRRPGTADEAAKAIAWLALENTFIQGKVIPVNGGI